MSDTDCRSALAVARDLAQKYQAAYEAERVANRYRGMQLGVAHEMTDKIRAATESLQHYVDENIEKFHTAKIANDALTECVSLCASKLRAEFGERRSRKGTFFRDGPNAKAVLCVALKKENVKLRRRVYFHFPPFENMALEEQKADQKITGIW